MGQRWSCGSRAIALLPARCLVRKARSVAFGSVRQFERTGGREPLVAARTYSEIPGRTRIAAPGPQGARTAEPAAGSPFGSAAPAKPAPPAAGSVSPVQPEPNSAAGPRPSTAPACGAKAHRKTTLPTGTSPAADRRATASSRAGARTEALGPRGGGPPGARR